MEEITPGNNFDIFNNIDDHCTECLSLIEILSINENNNIIEFQCSNKNNNHIKKIPIKEFLDKTKKDNKTNLNIDSCIIHNNKYINYCLCCNENLCKECLKDGNHINHQKILIYEIEPMKEESKIIKEIIDYYKSKLENLEMKKINVNNKLKELSKNNEKKIEQKIRELLEENNKRREIELKSNKKEYLSDLILIQKKYEKELKLRKKEYDIKINKIENQFKIIKEKIRINYSFQKEKYERKIKDFQKSLQLDLKISNTTNIKNLNELIFNTYNEFKNNYFNAININNIIINYYNNNNYIKNNIIIKNFSEDNQKSKLNIIIKRNKEIKASKSLEIKSKIKAKKTEVILLKQNTQNYNKKVETKDNSISLNSIIINSDEVPKAKLIKQQNEKLLEVTKIKKDTIYNEKLKEFREYYGLSKDEYPDVKLFEILRDNNFNFQKAFYSLFN